MPRLQLIIITIIILTQPSLSEFVATRAANAGDVAVGNRGQNARDRGNSSYNGMFRETRR